MKRPSKASMQHIILAVFLLLNIFIWSAVVRTDRHGILTVAFLDIGQGDGIYIEAPNGNKMIIDGGPSAGAELRALGQVMPFWDHSIDLVLATHPDQDHVGGLPAVIERMNVSYVVTTENSSGTGAYAAFEKAITEKGLERILARTGEKIILDEGVVLEILFPDRSTLGWDTNTSSIVARLSYGDESFLFTGDSPQSIEKYLVSKLAQGGQIRKDGQSLHSNVLKLGHHGSRTSSSQIFLSAVNPDYAIISAGLNNKYGHPHKEVTDLLTLLKIPSISTVDHGTTVFKTDGTELQIK